LQNVAKQTTNNKKERRMKRLAFVVVLVAAIVGIVFGGLSVANADLVIHTMPTPWPSHTPDPTCSPRPTPTPDCCQEVNGKATSIQGNISDMQSLLNTIDGNAANAAYDAHTIKNKLPFFSYTDTYADSRFIDHGGELVSSENYPLGAHFTLTIFTSGIANEEVIFYVYCNVNGHSIKHRETIQDDGWHYYEFDATSLYVGAAIFSGDGFDLGFVYTATY
jgi:hypothetical protein